MTVAGVPMATTLAEHGDVYGLQLLIRFGHLDPPQSPAVFWTAVAHNQVNVMDWWAVEKAWPIASHGRIEVEDSNYPVSLAVARRSIAAIEWLIDHPELVRHARATGSSLVAAIKDTCVESMLTCGMKELALRWIGVKYCIVPDERRGSHYESLTDSWDQPQEQWSSSLVQLVIQEDMMDVLDALEAGGPWYKALIWDDAGLILSHAIRCARFDLLDWWFESSWPHRLSVYDSLSWMYRSSAFASIDFVACVCKSQAPMEVLERYKSKHAAGGKGAHLPPLKYDAASAQGNTDVMDWLLGSGLPVSYTANAMDHAAVASLDWWCRCGLPLKYTEAAMDEAPNCNVLDWWLHSGLELKYTTKALESACNLQVFDWWKKQHHERGLELKYTAYLMDSLSVSWWTTGAIDRFVILNWWHDSGLEIKAHMALYSAVTYKEEKIVQWWTQHASPELLDKLSATTWRHAIDASSWSNSNNLNELGQCERLGLPATDDTRIIDECKSVGALQWWSGRFESLPFAYSEKALCMASQGGRVDLLNWWDRSGLELVYDASAMDLASASGMVNVLEWWSLSELVLKYTEAALDAASANRDLEVLSWWLKSGLELRYTAAAVNEASANGHVQVLLWWLNSGLEVKYTEVAVDAASANGDIRTLSRWFKSGLDLKCSKAAVDAASANGHLKVLTWWLKSGLELKYTEAAMDRAGSKGHVSSRLKVLKWWAQSMLPLKYSRKALEPFTSADNTQLRGLPYERVIWWWKNESGLELPIDVESRVEMQTGLYFVPI